MVANYHQGIIDSQEHREYISQHLFKWRPYSAEAHLLINLHSGMINQYEYLEALTELKGIRVKNRLNSVK